MSTTVVGYNRDAAGVVVPVSIAGVSLRDVDGDLVNLPANAVIVELSVKKVTAPAIGTMATMNVAADVELLTALAAADLNAAPSVVVSGTGGALVPAAGVKSSAAARPMKLLGNAAETANTLFAVRLKYKTF